MFIWNFFEKCLDNYFSFVVGSYHKFIIYRYNSSRFLKKINELKSECSWSEYIKLYKLLIYKTLMMYFYWLIYYIIEPTIQIIMFGIQIIFNLYIYMPYQLFCMVCSKKIFVSNI